MGIITLYLGDEHYAWLFTTYRNWDDPPITTTNSKGSSPSNEGLRGVSSQFFNPMKNPWPFLGHLFLQLLMRLWGSYKVGL